MMSYLSVNFVPVSNHDLGIANDGQARWLSRIYGCLHFFSVFSGSWRAILNFNSRYVISFPFNEFNQFMSSRNL